MELIRYHLMKKIIIVLFLFQAFALISQKSNFGNYYKLITEADKYLFSEVDYLKGVKILDSIMEYDGITDNNLNAAVVNFKLKRYTSSYKHFLKYAKSGNELTSLIDKLSDTSIFSFKKQDLDLMMKKYPKFKSEYTAIQQKAKLKYNVAFNNELIRLLYKDQSVRVAYQPLYDRLDSVSLDRILPILDEEFAKSDSLVFIELKSIIGRFGLPPRHELSNDAFYSFYIVILHGYTNKFSYSYCDSILKIAKDRFTKDLFVTPREYAAIMDRYYININGKNYYNELYDPTLPLFEPEKLNTRRKEIFLPEIDSQK